MRHKDFQVKMQEVLSRDYYPEMSDIFDWNSIEKIVEQHINKKEYNRVMIWSILTFQIWAKMYKVNRY